MLTCVIRYHIDPTKKAEFEHYARNWGQAIPRCGADLIGYYAPHEGSSTLAYGITISRASPTTKPIAQDCRLIRSGGKTTSSPRRKDSCCARTGLF